MLISYGRHSIDKTDIKSVSKALKSNFLTQGSLVKKFEILLKKKLHTKYATVVNSGSSALLLVGKILKWKKGDLVAVPPITFLSSVNTVEHCGAKPVFVDINMEDYCMDPKKLETILEKDKYKKIKAAIITDYGGQPAQWEKFFELKKKYKIILINDNCHAIGSNIKKNYGYATKYADFATLSFHPVKAITTGEGGAVLTNNLNYDNKAKLLRSHGMERKNNIYWVYKMNHLGFNFRLPDINCALGISQLKRIDTFISRRRKISKIYNKFFSDKEKFTIPKKIKGTSSSFHLYPLLLNFRKIKINKNNLIKKFLNYGIKLQVHYIPVNSQPYYRKKYGLNLKNYINSFKFYNSELSIPIYYDLKNREIKKIFKVCKKLLKNKIMKK